MNRTRYRFRQGWHYLTSSEEAVDYVLVRAILDEPALSLFRRMPIADQVHACCVLAALQATGLISDDLSRAALLHDVGKTQAGLSIFYRTCVVLLRRLFPKWLAALSAKPEPAWRRPFYIQARHAALGAYMARNAGCSERTVWLIEHHDLRSSQGTGMIADKELLALQAADDVC
ncbi:MAG: hypothetical protein LLG44_14090 [Chloroflexi bacterium]|nr:hypothetical protein [Chloroflexota bacterium]